MILTIDGPAGSGKSTVARLVAKKLHWVYFDTGALYRALTYKITCDQISLEDASSLAQCLAEFHFEMRDDSLGRRYFVSGEEVTRQIRTEAITQRVSTISAKPQVRQALLEIQRAFGANGNAVFDGRDMGTVVFPQAEVKIFLTATPAVRAQRRALELGEVFEKRLLDQLIERDRQDIQREAAPLRAAPDAYTIDTSELTVEQVVEQILQYVEGVG